VHNNGEKGNNAAITYISRYNQYMAYDHESYIDLGGKLADAVSELDKDKVKYKVK
jgi:hypothetical protein|tara:strand:- start:696 stop:860 length:165 start_codon:yes stop_codon:yes gene_type:complete